MNKTLSGIFSLVAMLLVASLVEIFIPYEQILPKGAGYFIALGMLFFIFRGFYRATNQKQSSAIRFLKVSSVLVVVAIGSIFILLLMVPLMLGDTLSYSQTVTLLILALVPGLLLVLGKSRLSSYSNKSKELDKRP